MNGYNVGGQIPARLGPSYRCLHQYHSKCDKPGCSCTCHTRQAPPTPDTTPLPTPDKAT